MNYLILLVLSFSFMGCNRDRAVKEYFIAHQSDRLAECLYLVDKYHKGKRRPYAFDECFRLERYHSKHNPFPVKVIETERDRTVHKEYPKER